MEALMEGRSFQEYIYTWCQKCTSFPCVSNECEDGNHVLLKPVIVIINLVDIVFRQHLRINGP